MTVAFEFNEVAGELNLSDFHFEAEAQRENSIALVSRCLKAKPSAGSTNSMATRLLQPLVRLYPSLSDEFVFMWEAEGMPNEKGIDWERQHSSIYYKEVGLGRYLTDGQSKDSSQGNRGMARIQAKLLLSDCTKRG